MTFATAVIPTHRQTVEVLSRAILSAIPYVDEVVVVIDREQDLPNVKATYVHSPGEGISAALNCGIAVAKGTRIAFLDSDDQWLRGKAQQLMRPEAATFTAYRIGNVVHPCNGNLGRIFTDNIPCRSTTVVDRWVIDKVGGFDDALTWCQDWDFHAKVQQAIGWTLIPEVLAEIADLPTGHTRTANDKERAKCRATVARRYRKR